MPADRQTERPGPGNPGHADPEDPGARADARVRHRRPHRADQQGRVPGQRRVAVPGLPPPGAGRADHRRVGSHGEQPPREVLPPHRAGPRQAQTRRPRIGKSRRRRSPEFFERRWESCDGRLRSQPAADRRIVPRACLRDRRPRRTGAGRGTARVPRDGGRTEDADRDDPRGRRPRRARRDRRPRSGEGSRPRRRLGIGRRERLAGRALRGAAAARSRPASPRSRCSRWRWASAPTPPSSASSTRSCSCGRCRS